MEKICDFDALTAADVYEILKLRCKVFAIEQRMVYIDMDDVDYAYKHIFAKRNRGA